MPSFHQHFDVSYQISLHATRDCFAPDNDTLVQAMEAHAGGRPVRALVYIDEGALMHDIHLAQRVNGWFTNHRSAGVEIATEPEVVMGGEALKDDMAILDKIGLATFNHGLCRHSYIIVIGDEAVLEAVGFAASLIHRGIRQIRMPTSAIAQCRTGRRIGNGVNRFGSRNYYGTSTPPRAIINDSRFLENVDDCSWKAVISEAVRMAVIDNHGLLGEMWERINLMHGRDLPTLAWLVHRCATIGMNQLPDGGVPAETERLFRIDRCLQLDHILECLNQHHVPLGEAIAIGVAIISLYAEDLGTMPSAESQCILNILCRSGFRLWDEALDAHDANGRRFLITEIVHHAKTGSDWMLPIKADRDRGRSKHDGHEAALGRSFARLYQCMVGRGQPAVIDHQVDPMMSGNPACGLTDRANRDRVNRDDGRIGTRNVRR